MGTRMRRATMALLAVLIGTTGLSTCTPVAAQALPMSAADVVALGGARDGEEVLFEGEAIGDVLRATDGMRWINVLSGGIAVGVVMSAADADRVTHMGRYGEVGTTLAIRGTYRFGCDEHGGDLDVHATEVTIVAPGGLVDQDPGLWKLPVAAALLVVASVEYAWFRTRRRFRTA